MPVERLRRSRHGSPLDDAPLRADQCCLGRCGTQIEGQQQRALGFGNRLLRIDGALESGVVVGNDRIDTLCKQRVGLAR